MEDKLCKIIHKMLTDINNSGDFLMGVSKEKDRLLIIKRDDGKTADFHNTVLTIAKQHTTTEVPIKNYFGGKN